MLGDLVTLGHDVVKQDLIGGSAAEGLAEQLEIGRGNGHRLVRQHVEAGDDGTADVFGLARVVAGQHHDVPRPLSQHPFEEIRSGINLLLPARGLISATVETFDQVEMLLQVRPSGRIDVHHRADLRIHELLDQARMEVSGVEGDEADVICGGGDGGGEAHDEETEGRGSPSAEARRPKEGGQPENPNTAYTSFVAGLFCTHSTSKWTAALLHKRALHNNRLCRASTDPCQPCPTLTNRAAVWHELFLLFRFTRPANLVICYGV